MKRSRQRGLAAVLATGAMVALAGCSGSSAPPAAVPTGSDVNVWAVYPGNVGSDQIGAGVKAGIRAINAAGGIGGHNVVVKECKDDLTPQGEIQCIQQAADDPDAIALISPLIITAMDDTDAIMQKAGLPGINSSPDTPASLSSAMQFPLGQALYDVPGCAVLGAEALNAKSVAFANTATPQTIEQSQVASDLLKAKNVATAGLITFPLTTTDVTPFVQQAVSSTPDLIVPGMPPQLMGAWLSAQARTGYTGGVCVPDGLAPYQTLVGLGAGATSVYLIGSFPEPTWDYPVMKQFNDEAAAEVAAGDALASTNPANSPNQVLRGWMGTLALRQAAANLSGDDVTRESIVAALNKTTVTFGDEGKAPMAPIDFSKPGPDPDYPREFNTSVILKKWDPVAKTTNVVGDGQVPGESL